jgi:hypothetical protein
MKNEKKITKTTVNELFQWYIGGDWKEDWQITNTMLVDGEHAQTKEEPNGELTLERLVSLSDKEVEVTNEVDPFDRIWEISFTLEGKEYDMQATTFFPDEEDGY